MASLTAHLLETGDHGRLGFRSDCPVCREGRLLGTLSSEPLVSRRAQAALATGALAVSLAAPSPLSAQEPDTQQEGVVAPELPGAGSVDGAPVEDDSTGFDPGGDTALPDELAPPAGAPGGGFGGGADEGGPVEAEPVDDPDARLVPLGELEGAPEADAPGASAPVTPAPVPPAPVAPAPTTPTPPAVQAPEAPSATQPTPTNERSARSRAGDHRGKSGRVPDDSRRESASHTYVPQEPSTSTYSGAVQSVSVTATVPSAATEVETGARSVETPLSPNARTYVVRPGDSLWSIAKRLLGSDASVAVIAREVARLWQLNEGRIATGDPDLLLTGTKLILR